MEIGEDLLRQIRIHGVSGYPNECCGALLGLDDGSGMRHVREIRRLDNRRNGDSARTRYLVTAEDHVHTEKIAREKGLELLGFYHSHPDHPAIPSDFDREHAMPWYSYLILAVEGGIPQDVMSWRLADDRTHFEKERIVVIPVDAPIRIR